MVLPKPSDPGNGVGVGAVECGHLLSLVLVGAVGRGGGVIECARHILPPEGQGGGYMTAFPPLSLSLYNTVSFLCLLFGVCGVNIYGR